MGKKIAIIIYSMFGHIAQMAEAEKKGVEEAGGQADIFQVPETMTEEELKAYGSPPKTEYPLITHDVIREYDAYLFGIATRYANFTAQFKTFVDGLGPIWYTAGMFGKFAGAFVSCAGPGGGQESTYYSILSTLVHQGCVFVPLGYKNSRKLLVQGLEDNGPWHGGSPWGAGCFAVTGRAQILDIEAEIAVLQGKQMWERLNQA